MIPKPLVLVADKDEPSRVLLLDVVAMSASALAGGTEKLKQAGCDAILAKPAPLGAILAQVRRFVGTAKGKDAT